MSKWAEPTREHALWLADKLAGSDYVQEAAAMLRKWPADSAQPVADRSAEAISKVVVEYRKKLGAVGGLDNELVSVPAGGVRNLLDAIDAAMGTPQQAEPVALSTLTADYPPLPGSRYSDGSLKTKLFTVEQMHAYVDADRAASAPAPQAVLPYDVTVGGGTFRKGVKLATFVLAAQGWHRAANPKFYTLTGEEKAENLRRLQDCASPSQPVAAEGSPPAELTERERFVWVLGYGAGARKRNADQG